MRAIGKTPARAAPTLHEPRDPSSSPRSAGAEQPLEQWKAARAKDTIVDTGWKP
jgi:hypothetical protein